MVPIAAQLPLEAISDPGVATLLQPKLPVVTLQI